MPDAFALVRELIPNAAATLFLRADTAAEARAQQALDETVVTALPPPNGYYFSDSSNFAPVREDDFAHAVSHPLEQGVEAIGSIALMESVMYGDATHGVCRPVRSRWRAGCWRRARSG